MTPAEALTHLNKGDPKRIVPPIYRKMPRAWLRELVKESSPGGAASPAGPAPVDPGAASVEALLQQAIARPERLRTPARRQVAFIQHFAGCRTLVEAAARAGINRRTVNRWRAVSPAFDQRLEGLVADHRRGILRDALPIADRPRFRPIFHHGRKVGEYERATRRSRFIC